MLNVIKRDGQIVPFDDSKIYNAISLANKATGNKLGSLIIQKITDTVVQSFQNNQDNIEIEKIQDAVVNTLIEMDYKELSKEYIEYRYKRDRAREANSHLIQTIRDLTQKDSKDFDLKRENANIDGDGSMGIMLREGSEAAKTFTHAYLLRPEVSKAHKEGFIHIHDLDFYDKGTCNCLQLDLTKLFHNGFSTGHGYLREPSNITTAAALAAIAIQADQNDMFGGQSIAKFDFDLAPYVSKTFIKVYKDIDSASHLFDDSISPIDKIEKFFNTRIENKKSLLDKDCFESFLKEFPQFDRKIEAKKFKLTHKRTNKITYQAMEGFVHNMNTLNSRAGAQVPFSSINYGTNTSPEGRMIIKNVMYALDAGLGEGETPIFPIHIFKVKDGINGEKGDPNYDLFQLACKVSGHRLFPNFTFIDAPFNLQYYKPGHPETESATMGCVHGDSYIHVKSKFGEYNSITLFKCFWDKLIDTNVTHTSGLSEYIDIENKDWYILDSKNNTYSKIKKVIRNPDMGNWIKIKIDNNIQDIKVTEDHPLQVMRDSSVKRIPACNITMADKLIASSGELLVIRSIEYVGSMNSFSYDVETESDTFDFNGIRSHNCRTRVVGNVDKNHEIFTERGNLSFTTINLPRLAILSKHDINKFFEKLEEMLDLVVIELLDRYKLQCSRKVKNFPFLMGQGLYIGSENLEREDTVESCIKHGTLTIGFIGLAECLKALIGKHHGESQEAQELGLKIVGRIRERCDEETAKHGLNFSCMGSPAEGTSGRFTDIDKKEFGIIEGVTDREYYTNSNHVPVYYNISITDKIDIEAPYHALENAGHISYVEVTGDVAHNPEAFEQIIQYMKKAGIGYGSINHPVDRDPVCGYVGVINDVCPRCGRREGEEISPEKLAEIKAHKYSVNSDIAENEKQLDEMYS